MDLIKKINIGSKVKIDVEGKNKSIEIVDFDKADADKGLISSHSPVGKALLGKQVGDKVEVILLYGLMMILEILEIN